MNRLLLSILGSLYYCMGSQLLYRGNSDAVHELDFDTFQKSVKEDTSSRNWILVFYAHWCGHCIHYAPEFINLAESYAGKAPVSFGAIDCADKLMSQRGSDDICQKYDIRSYPTIRLFRNGENERALPSKIEELRHEIDSIDTHLDDEVSHQSAGVDHSGDRYIESRSDDVLYDASLAMFESLSREVFRGSDSVLTRSGYQNLVRLLSLCTRLDLNFPIRDGCRSALSGVNKSTTLARARWNDILAQSFTYRESSYRACSSFSCAMWRLLHVISLSSESSSMSDIRFLVDEYFSCEECRLNFLDHYDRCEFGRCSAATSKEVALWLWRLHNGVSERLGNSKWPSRPLSDDEVFALLESIYATKTTPNVDGGGIFSQYRFFVLVCGIVVVVSIIAGVSRNRIHTTFSRITSQVNKKYYEPIV